jgi:hypothetical protein
LLPSLDKREEFLVGIVGASRGARINLGSNETCNIDITERIEEKSISLNMCSRLLSEVICYIYGSISYYRQERQSLAISLPLDLLLT